MKNGESYGDHWTVLSEYAENLIEVDTDWTKETEWHKWIKRAEAWRNEYRCLCRNGSIS